MNKKQINKKAIKKNSTKLPLAQRSGKNKYDIAVIGGGIIGQAIVKEFIKKKYNIILIDKKNIDFDITTNKNVLFKFFKGDACEFSVLEDSGISGVNTIVSTTSDDKVNLVVSLLAKMHFNIPTVIAKVNDVKNEWLFNESWGVDKYISQTRLITSMIEDSFMFGNFVKLFSFGKNNTSLYEYTIDENSKHIGELIRNLRIPKSSELITIIRDGNIIKPLPDNAIEAYDQLLFFVGSDAEKKLKRLG